MSKRHILQMKNRFTVALVTVLDDLLETEGQSNPSMPVEDVAEIIVALSMGIGEAMTASMLQVAPSGTRAKTLDAMLEATSQAARRFLERTAA